MAEAPATNTVWMDVELIDLPADARPHAPEDIQDMANDLKDNGQIQNIVVQRKGDRYEVIAGARRTKAAQLAGWKQIRAEIRENVSEFQRLDIMFSENEDRVEANPIYQARLLDNMLKADPKMTQTQLAEKKGKTSAWLSQYLGLLDLPKEAAEILTAVKISTWAARSIKKLPRDGLKIQVAQELREGKLKPEDVINRVQKLSAKPEEPITKAATGKLLFHFQRKNGEIVVIARLPGKYSMEELWEALCSNFKPWLDKNPAS